MQGTLVLPVLPPDEGPDPRRAPLEELFRARVIAVLAGQGLLLVARANMLRGQRDWHVAEEAKAGLAIEVMDVSAHKPPRMPSAKRRELIKKVWEADLLLCPKCQKEMCIVALIADREVIERTLRHLGLWLQGVRITSAAGPPHSTVIEPGRDDPLPGYDAEPVMAYANGQAIRGGAGPFLDRSQAPSCSPSGAVGARPDHPGGPFAFRI